MNQEKKPKILCVDDEKLNLKLMKSVLEPEGYEFQGVETGESALTLAAQDSPDLILLDIMMPKMTGFEVLRKLRADEKTRLIPVVMITALKETEDRVEALEAGCDDFISKPFDRTELLARVKSLLRISYYRRQLNEKEKFDYILDKMGDGFIVLDADLQIVKMNGPARRLLGIPAITQNIDVIAHILRQFHIYYFEGGNLREVIKERPIAFDIERMETDAVKKLILEIRSNAIKKPQLNEIDNVLLYLRDVTEQRYEENIKRDFLGFISHKLKTPITTVKSALDLLKSKMIGAINEKQEKFVDSALKGSVELISIVDRLIVFVTLANKKELLKEAVPLAEFLLAVGDSVKKQFPDKPARVDVICENEPAVVSIDKGSLTFIAGELFYNAVKFNDKAEAKITVKIFKTPGKIRISVLDNGPGIPPEDQKKIFEKFYQVEKDYTGNVRGIGIGLAMVKHLTEICGGTVSINSVLYGGAEFVVTLPG